MVYNALDAVPVNGDSTNNVIEANALSNCLNGLDGNDKLIGRAGNDTLNGGIGSDTMFGGVGDDIYFVDNEKDLVVEYAEPPDCSWIQSESVRDIYVRDYPRLMGNQWHVAKDGMYGRAAEYALSGGGIDWEASWQKNQKYNEWAVKYLDYIVLNRDSTRSGVSGEDRDLFLDNYNSIKNPQTGLGATLFNIRELSAQTGNYLYVLPYLNMSDVRYEQSINYYPEWTFWHSQEMFSGANFGTWDYCNDNNLFLTKNDMVLHYFNSSRDDNIRFAFDPNNPLWQQYYAAHVKGIVESGFDGVFSDNWARSKFGDLIYLSNQEFAVVQSGWNYIGELVKQSMENSILIGNSPTHSLYTSRDMQMLEDRIDDIIGTNDKSIASYFRYSEKAKQDGQVCQDTYFEEERGPFETFRLPINLLTDNIFGFGLATNKNTPIEDYIEPIKNISDIGHPLNNMYVVTGTGTGVYDFNYERAVYTRDYTGGVVYLNDTESQKNIKLPDGEWLRSDGIEFAGGSIITLDSKRGWVFKRIDSYTYDCGGVDTVNSSISYVLPKEIENIILTGNSNIDATGNFKNNSLTGNIGNNLLNGLEGDDEYIFNMGWGRDIIEELSGEDKVNFGEGISLSNLVFSKEFNDLILNLSDSTDSIIVKNWYLSESNKIEHFFFNGGEYLTDKQVEEKVNHVIEPPPPPPPPHPVLEIQPTITGTDGRDTLYKFNENDDIYLAKKANDYILDRKGNDTYLFASGDGQDVVKDISGNDSVIFLDKTPEKIEFVKAGSNLYMQFSDSTDYIKFQSWFYGDENQIEQVIFKNGVYLTNNDVNNIVQNISSYSSGELSINDLLHSSLTGYDSFVQLYS